MARVDINGIPFEYFEDGVANPLYWSTAQLANTGHSDIAIPAR